MKQCIAKIHEIQFGLSFIGTKQKQQHSLEPIHIFLEHQLIIIRTIYLLKIKYFFLKRKITLEKGHTVHMELRNRGKPNNLRIYSKNHFETAHK